MNWHDQQEEALQKLHKNRDTEVFSLFMQWIYAHFRDSQDNLSRPMNSDEELKFMHFQAMLFKTILTELDESFIHDLQQ